MTSRDHLIFINYRGSDENWATELVYARVTEAFGPDTAFKAGNSIRPGDAFPPVLRREAACCPVMLACIGPNWLTAGSAGEGHRLDHPDDWVRREIAIALSAGNHVIPLLIGNPGQVSIPDPDLLPSDIRDLAHRQARRLAPGGGLDQTIPELIARLAELVPELAERRARASGATATAAGQVPSGQVAALLPQKPAAQATGAGSVAFCGDNHGVVSTGGSPTNIIRR